MVTVQRIVEGQTRLSTRIIEAGKALNYQISELEIEI